MPVRLRERDVDPVWAGQSTDVEALRGRAAAGGPLDLHEGIVDPPAPRLVCERWPEHLRLLNLTTGELLPGRCKATNLCPYCQRLYVVETVEMLTLDAMEYAPSTWLVLTAREHLSRADCRRHLEQLRRSLRKTWPGIEWFVQAEFQRRGALHLNLLLKGVPVADLRELYEAATSLWCSRVDASAGPFEDMARGGQWGGVVQDGVGVVRYVSKMLAHGLKAEQAPPMGWRGHRTSQTRGYLVRPASVMREEARESLREKRRLWKLLAGHPEGESIPAALLEIELELARERASDASWRLVDLVGVGPDLARRMRDDARAPIRRAREVSA